jgi:hypothetical protein
MGDIIAQMANRQGIAQAKDTTKTTLGIRGASIERTVEKQTGRVPEVRDINTAVEALKLSSAASSPARTVVIVDEFVRHGRRPAADLEEQASEGHGGIVLLAAVLRALEQSLVVVLRRVEARAHGAAPPACGRAATRPAASDARYEAQRRRYNLLETAAQRPDLYRAAAAVLRAGAARVRADRLQVMKHGGEV